MEGGSSFIRCIKVYWEESSFISDVASYLGLTGTRFDLKDISKKEIQRKADQFEDFLMITDYRFRVSLINKQYLRFLGVRRENVEGLECFDVLNSLGSSCDGCPWPYPLLDGACVTVVREFSDGSLLEFHMIPLFDDEGNVVGIWQLGKLIKKGERKLAATVAG